MKFSGIQIHEMPGATSADIRKRGIAPIAFRLGYGKLPVPDEDQSYSDQLPEMHQRNPPKGTFGVLVALPDETFSARNLLTSAGTIHVRIASSIASLRAARHISPKLFLFCTKAHVVCRACES